jgi:hypothetical protein
VLWLIHAVRYTGNVFWGMNIGFCIYGHLLSHKKNMTTKRNLYTKTIKIVYSLRLWNQWNKGMELREREKRKENYRP